MKESPNDINLTPTAEGIKKANTVLPGLVMNADCSVSHVRHFCDDKTCNPPGSSVHGIFRAKILEWAAISFSRGSSPSRDRTVVSRDSCFGRWVLYHRATWEARVIMWLGKGIPGSDFGGQALGKQTGPDLVRLLPSITRLWEKRNVVSRVLESFLKPNDTDDPRARVYSNLEAPSASQEGVWSVQ